MLSGLRLAAVSYDIGAFIVGIVLVYALLTVEYATDLPDFGLLGSNLVYGAILEEVLKFVAVYGLYRWSQLPAAALFVGLGFGLGERLLYLTASGVFTAYDMLALGMHLCAGASSMYFLSRHKTTSLRRDLVLALVAPMTIHGFYNLMIWGWYSFVASLSI